eukprot:GHVN01054089.1.p1 GENE.GHVN01054089.1~~GHVN01054089.1.p1  ORF type:complete len:231 (+),score=64.41 GHVN01054089.1:37-693(+)
MVANDGNFSFVENRKRRVNVFAEKRKGIRKTAHNSNTERRERQAIQSVIANLGQTRNSSTQFVDKRIGEKKKGLTREQKSILRLRKIRKQTTKSKFVLSDVNQHGTLTHGGCAVEDISDELLMSHGKGLMDDESDEDIDEDTTALHFGGGDEEKEATPGQPAKKNKMEVYKEIMEKSKRHRAERVKEKMSMEEEVEGLDAEFKDLQTQINSISRPPRM